MSFCTNCGTRLEDDAAFCTNCGMRVQDNHSAQPASPSVQPSCPPPDPRPEGGKGKRIALVAVLVVLALALIAVGFTVLKPAVDNALANRSSQALQSAQQESKDQSGSSANGSEKSQDSASASAGKSQDSASASSSIAVASVSGFACAAQDVVFPTYSASSTLSPSEYGNYWAENLDDDSWSTAWVEGASGSGAGQSVRMTSPSDQKKTVTTVEIMAGYAKSTDIYYKNSRPKQISLLADSGKVIAQVTLADSYQTVQRITFPAQSTSSITLRIDSVYEGNKYEDCAISELRCS